MGFPTGTKKKLIAGASFEGLLRRHVFSFIIAFVSRGKQIESAVSEEFSSEAACIVLQAVVRLIRMGKLHKKNPLADARLEVSSLGGPRSLSNRRKDNSPEIVADEDVRA